MSSIPPPSYQSTLTNPPSELIVQELVETHPDFVFGFIREITAPFIPSITAVDNFSFRIRIAQSILSSIYRADSQLFFRVVKNFTLERTGDYIDLFYRSHNQLNGQPLAEGGISESEQAETTYPPTLV